MNASHFFHHPRLDDRQSQALLAGLSRPVDSAKSQKQITLSGEEINWGSSDIDCRASSINGYRTEALRTLIVFQGRHKARDFNSADSKAA